MKVFTGQMPFLSPTNSVIAVKGNAAVYIMKTTAGKVKCGRHDVLCVTFTLWYIHNLSDHPASPLVHNQRQWMDTQCTVIPSYQLSRSAHTNLVDVQQWFWTYFTKPPMPTCLSRDGAKNGSQGDPIRTVPWGPENRQNSAFLCSLNSVYVLWQ